MYRVVGLIPAYNAEKTIERVIRRIPPNTLDALIVLNDGSCDRTPVILKEIVSSQRKLGSIPAIHLVHHEKNQGYTAAQKRLYAEALKVGAKHCVIFHADEAHAPEEIPSLLKPLENPEIDIVYGSRILGIQRDFRIIPGFHTLWRASRGPMPAYKYVANRILTHLMNRCVGSRYSTFHCGFRACKTNILEKMNLDGFKSTTLFDTEFLVVAHRLNLKVCEIPVSTYYSPDAGSSVNLIKYGLENLKYMADLLRKKRPNAKMSS